jgi:hypothetical protein
MPPTIITVHAKARAFVEALTRLPHRARAAVPHGHFARDYNTLRKLALEAVPRLDRRLLGKYIDVYETPNGEFSRASYVEIEVYARQIVEQLALLIPVPGAEPAGADTAHGPGSVVAKTYDVAVLRKEHCQAYAPWSEQDDEYLRSRFLEGATLRDLVSEFGRQPGGIRSRLRKLGLGQPTAVANAAGQGSQAGQLSVEERPRDQPARLIPEWKRLNSRAGKSWSLEEDRALVKGFEAGFSLEELARSLGRGVFAVEVRLSKLGRDATVRSGRPTEQVAAADGGRHAGSSRREGSSGGPGS